MFTDVTLTVFVLLAIVIGSAALGGAIGFFLSRWLSTAFCSHRWQHSGDYAQCGRCGKIRHVIFK